MVEIVKTPDTWPLKRGETLSNHDWFPFHGHRFLLSAFVKRAVMEGRRADIGTAVMLWAEAMREDPAGTLPECDIELAFLARFASVSDWLAVRDGVLHGWTQVLVEDEESGELITRLGHPGFMQKVVVGMHKRKVSRDVAREAGNLSVKKTRIRKQMGLLKVEDHIIADDRAIDVLAEHFVNSGLFITKDNVRGAMVELLGYTGQVRKFPATAKRPDG